MESRNLDRALDIVSKLINGENVGDIYDCITTIESCIDHCCPLEEALENRQIQPIIL